MVSERSYDCLYMSDNAARMSDMPYNPNINRITMKNTGSITPNVMFIPNRSTLMVSWLTAKIVLDKLSLSAFPIKT